MRKVCLALTLGLSQGLAGASRAGPAETMTVQAFVSRCVVPMESGDLPDLSDLSSISSFEQGGRELFWKDLPGPGNIQEIQTRDNRFVGCSVDSDPVAEFDHETLAISFEAWADSAIEQGRYVDLPDCTSESFTFIRVVQYAHDRPNGLVVRVFLVIGEEPEMFMFFAGETDPANLSCGQGGQE